MFLSTFNYNTYWIYILKKPAINLMLNNIGSCQICASVQNCMRTQICTNILLHEGIKLHVDIFARVVFLLLFLFFH